MAEPKQVERRDLERGGVPYRVRRLRMASGAVLYDAWEDWPPDARLGKEQHSFRDRDGTWWRSIPEKLARELIGEQFPGVKLGSYRRRLRGYVEAADE